ncbi:hypothetical protein H5410_004447 [Solanum commersonii]|uniref:Craniofacial development protein 2-like n=1 Tax=Solanum commersonii TaxID=4109 RepID=A0A9J6B817_SOLCO|nr:hypothetical protein H5410_004447 [Solanum commersonii]
MGRFQGSRCDGFKLWYFRGGSRDRNGVGILVDGVLRELVVEVRRINDRLMLIKLVIGVRGIPITEKIVIGGDFNGHIGATSNGFDDVHGGFGFGERNGGGSSLLEFAKAFELLVANFEIDYLLLRKGDRGLVKDCKVIPSEDCTTQHKLLVMDLVIKRDRRKKIVADRPRIKWGGLTPDLSRELGEKLSGMGAWVGYRGKFGGHKGDWWWNGKSRQGGSEEAAYTKWVESREAKLSGSERLRRLTLSSLYAVGDKGGDKKLCRAVKSKREEGSRLGPKEETLCWVSWLTRKDFGTLDHCGCFRIEGGYRAISRMAREEAAGQMRFSGVLEEHGQRRGLEWLVGI